MSFMKILMLTTLCVFGSVMLISTPESWGISFLLELIPQEWHDETILAGVIMQHIPIWFGIILISSLIYGWTKFG